MIKKNIYKINENDNEYKDIKSDNCYIFRLQPALWDYGGDVGDQWSLPFHQYIDADGDVLTPGDPAGSWEPFIPGPTIRGNVGDIICVTIQNRIEDPDGHFVEGLKDETIIHWHGIEISNCYDGTPVTQTPIPAGTDFTYRFQFVRPGVFWYHPHWDSMIQNPLGANGAIICDDVVSNSLRTNKIIPHEDHTFVISLTDISFQSARDNVNTYVAVENINDTTVADAPLYPELFIRDIMMVGAAQSFGDVILINGKHEIAFNDEGNTQQFWHEGKRTETDPIEVANGESISVYVTNNGIHRFYKIHLAYKTESDNEWTHSNQLFRIGGEGGLLDEARQATGNFGDWKLRGIRQRRTTDGGTGPQEIQTTSELLEGEFILPTAARQFVAFYIDADWTEVVLRASGYSVQTGSDVDQNPDNLIIARFVVTKPTATYILTAPIDAETKLRTNPVLGTLVDPIEDLSTAAVDAVVVTTFPHTKELDDSVPVPVSGDDIMQDYNIRLSRNLAGGGSGPSINGYQVEWDDNGPLQDTYNNTRYVKVNDIVEWTIETDTFVGTGGADHPWHLHGFSFQPVKMELNKGTIDEPDYVTLYEWEFREFMDVIYVPTHHRLTYRFRVEDRSFIDNNGTLYPGGVYGRWLSHCHIFKHAHNGMMMEFIVVDNNNSLINRRFPTDVYLRDNVGDDGTVPSTGTISISPDIILRPNKVVDGTISFGEGSGTENSSTLGYEVEFGQDNYIYVRVKNRGLEDTTDVTTDVYWSEVSTLVTPDDWHYIGTTDPVDVPKGDSLVVTEPITWASSDIPAEGHYCLVGITGNTSDPKTLTQTQVANFIASGMTWEEFDYLIRGYNNVTWRNFNVIDVLPNFTLPLGPYKFKFKGAWDKERYFDILIRPLGEIIWKIPIVDEFYVNLIEQLNKQDVYYVISKRTISITIKRDLLIENLKFLQNASYESELWVNSSDPINKNFFVSQIYKFPSGDTRNPNKVESREVGRVTWRHVDNDDDDNCLLEPNSICLIENKVMYHFVKDISSFQFKVNGSIVRGKQQEGDAVDSNFSINIDNNMVYAMGEVIPAGCGNLLTLQLSNYDGYLSDIVVIGKDNRPIIISGKCPDYYKSECHDVQDSLIVPLNEGWNILSGISFKSQIVDNDIVVPNTLYTFNDGSYVSSSELSESKGYWIRSEEKGNININSIYDIRHRKEVTTMSKESRIEYINAYLAAWNDPSGQLKEVVNSYQEYYSRGLHNNGAFLPWHRSYLLTVENILREHNPNVTIPYWDWTLWNKVTDSDIWGNESHQFSDGGDSDHNVVEGPFGQLGPFGQTNGDTLHRNFQPDSASSAHDIENLFTDFPNSSDYNGFRKRLEHGPGMHDSVHCLVGGTMCSVRAANDPVFWMLHAYVDNLWCQWQKQSPEHQYTYFGDLQYDDMIPGAYKNTIRGMMNNLGLPGNVQVMYEYNEPKSVVLSDSTVPMIMGVNHDINIQLKLTPSNIIDEPMYGTLNIASSTSNIIYKPDDRSDIIYKPSNLTLGTILFNEDSGDQDYNDVVLRYNIALYKKGDKVSSMIYKIYPTAYGTSNIYGLRLRLGGMSKNIKHKGFMLSLDGGRIELVQKTNDKNELEWTLFDNLRNAFSVDDRTSNNNINTEQYGIITPVTEYQIHIIFNKPETLYPEDAPFDLYLYNDSEYYHIEEPSAGLPHILNIPKSIPWPTDGNSLNSLYPSFSQDTWNGTDWYNNENPSNVIRYLDSEFTDSILDSFSYYANNKRGTVIIEVESVNNNNVISVIPDPTGVYDTPEVRIRKEITQMSVDERERYINVYKAAYDDDSTIINIKAHATMHQNLFSSGIHNNGTFLPWHRWCLLQIENILRDKEASMYEERTVTIPYWDWSLHPKINESTFWGDGTDQFSGDGDDANSHNIMTGSFEDFNKPELKRNIGNGSSATQEVIQSSLLDRYPSYTQYDNFRNRLEHGPGLHDSIHNIIGGSMASGGSANDPIFFSHHANIDRIWSVWQENSEDHIYAYVGNTARNDSMPGTSTVPADMLHMEHLNLDETHYHVIYGEDSDELTVTYGDEIYNYSNETFKETFKFIGGKKYTLYKNLKTTSIFDDTGNKITEVEFGNLLKEAEPHGNNGVITSRLNKTLDTMNDTDTITCTLWLNIPRWTTKDEYDAFYNAKTNFEDKFNDFMRENRHLNIPGRDNYTDIIAKFKKDTTNNDLLDKLKIDKNEIRRKMKDKLSNLNFSSSEINSILPEVEVVEAVERIGLLPAVQIRMSKTKILSMNDDTTNSINGIFQHESIVMPDKPIELTIDESLILRTTDNKSNFIKKDSGEIKYLVSNGKYKIQLINTVSDDQPLTINMIDNTTGHENILLFSFKIKDNNNIFTIGDIKSEHILNINNTNISKDYPIKLNDIRLDITNQKADAGANTIVDTEGWKGTNLRACIFEGSAGNEVATKNRSGYNLVSGRIEESYDRTLVPGSSSHATTTTAIITNTYVPTGTTGTSDTTQQGFAPDALIYAANDYSLDALEWAITGKEARVVNQSWHTAEDWSSSSLTYPDILKDYLVLHYPYPFITSASGNWWAGDGESGGTGTAAGGDKEYVNHKGYNYISVGNHQDFVGGNPNGMINGTVWLNPVTSHNDRELPEMSANGTSVTWNNEARGSGTSFSSPAVAGTALLLQNADNALLYWPEGIRAILLAGAITNVRDNNWTTDTGDNGAVSGTHAGAKTSTQDGAGALNTQESMRITIKTINSGRQSRNNNPKPRGWDCGTLKDSDFTDDNYVSYYIGVPNFGTNNSTQVKVALTWNSEIITYGDYFPQLNTILDILGIRDQPVMSTLTLDHDLYVYDESGRLVSFSTSWDNSYEIVDFTGQRGAIYEIRIKRHSGSGNTWYGIAWTSGDGMWYRLISILQQFDLTIPNISAITNIQTNNLNNIEFGGNLLTNIQYIISRLNTTYIIDCDNIFRYNSDDISEDTIISFNANKLEGYFRRRSLTDLQLLKFDVVNNNWTPVSAKKINNKFIVNENENVQNNILAFGLKLDFIDTVNVTTDTVITDTVITDTVITDTVITDTVITDTVNVITDTVNVTTDTVITDTVNVITDTVNVITDTVITDTVTDTENPITDTVTDTVNVIS